MLTDPGVQITPLTGDEGIWDPPITSGPNASSFEVLSKMTREVMPDAFAALSLVAGQRTAIILQTPDSRQTGNVLCSLRFQWKMWWESMAQMKGC
jgi:hypothetical protein